MNRKFRLLILSLVFCLPTLINASHPNPAIPHPDAADFFFNPDRIHTVYSNNREDMRLINRIKNTRLDNLTFETKTCAPLKVGDVRIVTNSTLKSMTPLNQFYALKRISPNQIMLFFNLLFIDQEPSGQNRYLKSQFHTNMQGKVNGCFDRFNQLRLLTSQKTGTFVRLALYNEARHSKAHPQLKVPIIPIRLFDLKFKEEGIRASFDKFSLHDTDCSTIVHEVLHSTGLVDEYPDSQFKKRWTHEGLMGNHFKFLVQHGPHYSITPFYSARPTPQAQNKTYFLDKKFTIKKSVVDWPLSQHEFNDIKDEFILLTSEQAVHNKEIPHFDYVRNNFIPPHPNQIAPKFHQGPNHPKLLREDELNVILYPNCESKNSRYYQNARGAYEL